MYLYFEGGIRTDSELRTAEVKQMNKSVLCTHSDVFDMIEQQKQVIFLASTDTLVTLWYVIQARFVREWPQSIL